jgi:hypothetical protein
MNRVVIEAFPQQVRARGFAPLAAVLTLLCLAWASPALGQTAPRNDELTANRPDPDGVPTRISLAFYLVDIESIDDPQQEFTADLYLVARWRDARLVRPETSDDESQRLLPLSQIWQPDVGILNRRSMEATLPQVARVDTQGNVEYAQRVRGQFASPLDLRRFPFDRQQLEIRIISYRYAPGELELAVGRR